LRGVLRRNRKVSAPFLVSHITQHAVGDECLFKTAADRLVFLELLGEAARKFRFKLLSYCLMTNHVHLLLQQEEDNLPRSLKELFFRYSRKFNRKYSRQGHLFYDTYHQVACCDTSRLLSQSIYIHLNPVRAGMVADPEDYPWSSCRYFVRPLAGTALVDKFFILQMLGESPFQCAQAYRDLLSAARGEEAESGEDQKFALLLWDWRARGKLRLTGSVPAAGLSGAGDDEGLLELLRCVHSSGGFKSVSQAGTRRRLVGALRARGYAPGHLAAFLGVSERQLRR